MASQDGISPLSPRNVVQVLCHFEDTKEFRKELLCSLSKEIPPLEVLAVYLHERYVKIYFSKFDHVRMLMRNGLVVRNERYEVHYPYVIFSACNVLPTASYRDINDQFSQYGNIEQIVTLPFYPDDHDFKHILSCKRLIYVIPNQRGDIATIPDKFELKIGLSNEVVVHTYCVLCEEQGHSATDCKFRWPECDIHRHIRNVSSNSSCYINSPIYLPHDAFQCIAADGPSSHFCTAKSDLAIDSNREDTQQISQDQRMLPAFRTVSSTVSNAIVRPQSSLNTVDNVYSSAAEVKLPPRPNSLPVLAVSSAALFDQSSHMKHEEGEQLRQSGVQTLNAAVNSSRNAKTSRCKRMHKIWMHFLDTTNRNEIGKRSVKVVKCKYCEKEMRAIISRMILHYTNCKSTGHS